MGDEGGLGTWDLGGKVRKCRTQLLFYLPYNDGISMIDYGNLAIFHDKAPNAAVNISTYLLDCSSNVRREKQSTCNG